MTEKEAIKEIEEKICNGNNGLCKDNCMSSSTACPYQMTMRALEEKSRGK